MDLISYNLIVEIVRILVLLIFACKYLLAEEIMLELADGIIKGHIETTVTNATFYSFQGIPYACPSSNDLRFQDPIPVPNCDDILDATHQNICFQAASDNKSESEDCLYINVFTSRKFHYIEDQFLGNIRWPKVNTTNFPFLDIDSYLEIKLHPKDSIYTARNDIYENYGVQPYDTYTNVFK